MKNQIKELTEKLEKGIRNAMSSKGFKEFLKVQSMFHNYSPNNTMLIMLQNPDATRVMGYKTWQKLKRQVNKGEKGISILAPSTYNRTTEKGKLDKKTGKSVIGKDGNPEKEKTKVQTLGFRKVSVFDIAQTSGEELPDICKELTGDSKSAEKIISAIKSISEIPIKEGDTGSAKGYYHLDNNEIVYKQGMNMDQVAKTLVHEYTHYKLHNKEAKIQYDRRSQEVQAESVAYIVSNKLGLDTSDYSFDYIASWSSDKDLSELKESLSIIQKTSCNIIDKIQDVLEKEIEQEIERDKELNITELKSNDLDGTNKGNEKELDTAKELIMTFISDEYDQPLAPFDEADLKHVGIAHTTTEDGEYDIQAEIDLEDYSVNLYVNSELVSSQKYETLKDLIENELVNLDFNELTYVEDNDLEKVIKNDIVYRYQDQNPSIKHISGKGAIKLSEINQQEGKDISIIELKELQKKLGKEIENGDGNIDNFNRVQTVLDEINKCDFKEHNQQAQENIIAKEITTSNNMELTQ